MSVLRQDACRSTGTQAEADGVHPSLDVTDETSDVSSWLLEVREFYEIVVTTRKSLVTTEFVVVWVRNR